MGYKELAKLEKAQIAYWLPTIGAVREKEILTANREQPGLAIEFRETGGVWRAYHEPVAVMVGAIEIRAISIDGQRRGRSLIVP